MAGIASSAYIQGCTVLQVDAHALAKAGAGALVLEGIPVTAAAAITAELPIPHISH